MSLHQTQLISIVVNGESIHVPHDCTIVELLSELKIYSRAIAVELNQDILPANKFEIHRLSSGDTLEIVTLVVGG